jgi:hypothetical protein
MAAIRLLAYVAFANLAGVTFAYDVAPALHGIAAREMMWLSYSSSREMRVKSAGRHQPLVDWKEVFSSFLDDDNHMRIILAALQKPSGSAAVFAALLRKQPVGMRIFCVTRGCGLRDMRDINRTETRYSNKIFAVALMTNAVCLYSFQYRWKTAECRHGGLSKAMALCWRQRDKHRVAIMLQSSIIDVLRTDRVMAVCGVLAISVLRRPAAAIKLGGCCWLVANANNHDGDRARYLYSQTKSAWLFPACC